MSKTIRIKAVYAFGIAGKHIAQGDIVEASPVVASDLISRGRALPVRADIPDDRPPKNPATPPTDGDNKGDLDDKPAAKAPKDDKKPGK